MTTMSALWQRLAWIFHLLPDQAEDEASGVVLWLSARTCGEIIGLLWSWKADAMDTHYHGLWQIYGRSPHGNVSTQQAMED
jgi:hypothetical protein